MFCRHCGAKLETSSRFCLQCGKPVEENAPSPKPIQKPAPPSPSVAQTYAEKSTPTKKPNSQKVIVIAVVAVLLLLVIACVVAFFVIEFSDFSLLGDSASSQSSDDEDEDEDEDADEDEDDDEDEDEDEDKDDEEDDEDDGAEEENGAENEAANVPEGEKDPEVDGKTVGILTPNKEQTFWSIQGERLVAGYEAAGYKTEIEYAEDDAAKQAMQIENMIAKGVDALVIVAVDGAALTDVCEKAKEEGIVVIAEDRLITNTEAVDFHVTFDLVKMGELQGQYIVDALDLANAEGPFNLEIFSGSQDDPNAKLFYDGAMNILKSYIDEGKLVVQSGQVEFGVTAIKGWDSAEARSRMEYLLSGYYADKKIDAVLVAADCLTFGVVPALEDAGYGSGGLKFPIITGQDAELAAVKQIKAGKQSMTAFFDANELVKIIVPVTDSLLEGTVPEATGTYNNGVIEVPTQTYSPYAITAENIDYLVEVGFFTEEDING